MSCRRSLLLLLAGLNLTACHAEGTVCAAVFQIYTVSVQDQAGAPVEDAEVTSILVRTGDTLQNRTLALFAPGYYFVIDDSYAGDLFPSRDSVSVSITRGQMELAAGYAFRRSACGVQKLAGPDQVTLP
jgi:hypothetical protein